MTFVVPMSHNFETFPETTYAIISQDVSQFRNIQISKIYLSFSVFPLEILQNLFRNCIQNSMSHNFETNEHWLVTPRDAHKKRDYRGPFKPPFLAQNASTFWSIFDQSFTGSIHIKIRCVQNATVKFKLLVK